jgi:copper chaperone NosL
MQDSGSGIQNTRCGKRHVSLLALAIMVCIASLPTLSGMSSADQGATASNQDGKRMVRKGPSPGIKPLDKDGVMQISESDRCPVCAMRPVKYPKSSCAIQLKNGATFYFCATGCMIRAWMHPEIFLGAEKSDLHLPVVREYFTGIQMDARELKWVAGSDIVGPMGPALVPVQGEKEVETFRIRHGGKAVFRLEEMNDDRWREITGKHP